MTDASELEQIPVTVEKGAPRTPAGGYPVPEMFALYEQGTTLQAVGEKFGLSKSYVSKLFKAAGHKTRPAGSPAAEYPVQAMYALYQQGTPLQAVGEKFGTSTELTRLIFARAGFKTRSAQETQALKMQADLRRSEAIAGAIVDCFRRLGDPKLVASELGVPQQKVRSVLRSRLSEKEYRARMPEQRREPKYSEAELIEILQTSAAAHSEPLTINAYKKFANSQRVTAGQSWPSQQTYENRFGSWRAALLKAGLPANAITPGGRIRVFEAAQCIEALRSVHHALGKIPSAEEYAQYARGSKGKLPSTATIHKRCGTWNDALRMAGL